MSYSRWQVQVKLVASFCLNKDETISRTGIVELRLVFIDMVQLFTLEASNNESV